MFLQTLASLLLVDLNTQAVSTCSQSRTMPNLLFVLISTTCDSVLFGGCLKGAFALSTEHFHLLWLHMLEPHFPQTQQAGFAWQSPGQELQSSPSSQIPLSLQEHFGATRAAVGATAGVAAGSTTEASVGGTIGASVGGTIGASVGDTIGALVGGTTGAAVGGITGTAVGGTTGAPVGEATGAEVDCNTN